MIIAVLKAKLTPDEDRRLVDYSKLKGTQWNHLMKNFMLDDRQAMLNGRQDSTKVLLQEEN